MLEDNLSNDIDGYIGELEEFINQAELDLDHMVINKLQWNNLDSNAALSRTGIKCSICNNHTFIHESNYEKHLQKCIIKQQGVDFDEQYSIQPESKSYFKFELSEDNLKGIFENESKATPMSLRNYLIAYKPDERLLIQNSSLQHFSHLKSPYSLSWDGQNFIDLFLDENRDDGKVRSKSYSDLLAELRDRKRRRKSYRKGKAKMTQTELMRDLIQTQMDMLQNIEKLNNIDMVNEHDNSNLKIDKKLNENMDYDDVRHHKKRRSRSRSIGSRKKSRTRSRSRTKSHRHNRDGEKDKSKSPHRSHKKKHKHKDKKKKDKK